MRKRLSILTVLLLLTMAFAATPIAGARPFGPPPPTGCVSTYETDDLSDSSNLETHYNLTITTQLNGKFDSTTDALCYLQAQGSFFNNSTTTSYTAGDSVWLCIQVSASSCATVYSSSLTTNSQTIQPQAGVAYASGWITAGPGNCTGGKLFRAVSGDAHSWYTTNGHC